MTLATDIIAGFPGESDEDHQVRVGVGVRVRGRVRVSLPGESDEGHQLTPTTLTLTPPSPARSP